MRWIVTREKSDSHDLLAALPDAVCVPAIARWDLPWPVWPSADDRPLIYMVTSAHVANRLPDDGIPAAALEPKTASLLGPRVAVSARGGALALAQALVKEPYRVRYPTSDLADVSGIEVVLAGRLDVAVVYETVKPKDLAAQLKAVLTPQYGLYMASPSAVTNVLTCALPPPARVVLLGDTSKQRYDASKPRGFPNADWVGDQSAALALMLG